MSIQSYIDSILATVARHPPSLEEAEIVRLTLKIKRHYEEIAKRANEGDAAAHPFAGDAAEIEAASDLST